jgi:membrane protein DedA with SNARE-associated domain
LALDYIIHLLTVYKYFTLFPLAVVEGPILAVIAGLLCSEGFLNPVIAYPIIVLGDITGDSLLYALGRWDSGRPSRWYRWIGLTAEKIDRARTYFVGNPVKTVSLSKVILGAGIAGIFLAGNSRIPYRKFLVICLATSAGQYTVYLGIGLLFGRAYKDLNLYLNYIATISILLAFGLFFLLILKSLGKRR